MMLTLSGGIILMNEPPSTSISDLFGNVTDANKAIGFQMISSLELQNLSITTCNCIDCICDRQNFNDNLKNGSCCPCLSSCDTWHAKLTLSFGMTITMDNGKVIVVSDFMSHRYLMFFLRDAFPNTICFNGWDHTNKHL